MLGIPDVNTHVGSVIHAFENLAYQRQMKEGAEKIYESSKSSSSAGKKESIYKINLPPPPSKLLMKTASDDVPKQIVRHRPKSKAPDVPSYTVSATTQTAKLSGDDNESSDSLNLEEDYRRNNKFPQSYIKSYSVVPPSSLRQPSRIPTKTANEKSTRNQMPDSSLKSKPRTEVFLKNKTYSEDDIENDFLRGTTVSQSFIKNVVRKSPNPRKRSTYEQNFLFINDHNQNTDNKVKTKSGLDRNSRDQRSRSASTKLKQPLIDDEVSSRYKEYSSNNDIVSPRRDNKIQQSFQPRRIDRAVL